MGGISEMKLIPPRLCVLRPDEIDLNKPELCESHRYTPEIVFKINDLEISFHVLSTAGEGRLSVIGEEPEPGYAYYAISRIIVDPYKKWHQRARRHSRVDPDDAEKWRNALCLNITAVPSDRHACLNWRVRKESPEEIEWWWRKTSEDETFILQNEQPKYRGERDWSRLTSTNTSDQEFEYSPLFKESTWLFAKTGAMRGSFPLVTSVPFGNADIMRIGLSVIGAFFEALGAACAPGHVGERMFTHGDYMRYEKLKDIFFTPVTGADGNNYYTVMDVTM